MAAGRRQVLPFDDIPHIVGVTAGTSFEFERSWFDSYLAFERSAREDQRRVQRAGWLVNRDLRRASSSEVMVDCQRRLWLLVRLERFISDQVWAAKRAVDAELEEGRGRRCTVEAMRAEPRPPASVERHSDAIAWIEADRRRGVPDWPGRLDAGGEDYGYHWTLENPTRRWQTSRWRVSWLSMGDPTYEVYAIELPDRRSEAAETSRRLWVLGKLRERELVRDALVDLQRYAMNERNSLIAAAIAVRDAMAQEAAGPGVPPVPLDLLPRFQED
jgi:hypothetical protein